MKKTDKQGKLVLMTSSSSAKAIKFDPELELQMLFERMKTKQAKKPGSTRLYKFAKGSSEITHLQSKLDEINESEHED